VGPETLARKPGLSKIRTEARAATCFASLDPFQSIPKMADADNGAGKVERARFEALIAHLTPEKKTEARLNFERSDGASQEHFLNSLELIIGPYTNPTLAPSIPGGFLALVTGLPAPLKQAMEEIIAEHINLGVDNNPSFWPVMLCATGYRDGPPLTVG